jgi:EAL domain-containing protein (putative c-di-GMP-specific phosphodiesterase class I)
MNCVLQFSIGVGMNDSVGTTASAAEGGARAASLCIVIDSDPFFRQDFSNRLRGAGVDILEFSNSARLLESLDDHTPDVIFINVSAEDPFDCVRALSSLANSSFNGRLQLIGKCEPRFFESIGKFGQHLSLTMLPPMKKPVDFAEVRKIVREQKLVRAPASASELSLSDALAQNWTTFWYQPKVDQRNKKVVGAEALVRFIHPKHGVISPGHFLSGSREEELQALAKLAVEHALAVSANFQNQGIPLAIALNMSVESLLTLPVKELMAKHRPQNGQSPGLVIEVAERQAVNRINLLSMKFIELHKCGVGLALDHCGLGHSSFQMLSQIPFSEIKIDQSLVRDCDKDRARANVCKTIIQMAHNFTAKATAVGIETAAESQQLASLGCDFTQGFLFGKPMTEHQLMNMIITSRDGSKIAS